MGARLRACTGDLRRTHRRDGRARSHPGLPSRACSPTRRCDNSPHPRSKERHLGTLLVVRSGGARLTASVSIGWDEDRFTRACRHVASPMSGSVPRKPAPRSGPAPVLLASGLSPTRPRQLTPLGPCQARRRTPTYRVRCRSVVRGVELVHAGDGSLGAMFDHVGIAVRPRRVGVLYRRVLSVLGVEPVTRTPTRCVATRRARWSLGGLVDRLDGPRHPVTRGLHVGFRAPDRAAVDAFWRAGIDAGHLDDGARAAPGLGPDYYGCFLLDPDSNSVEAANRRGPCPTPSSTMRLRVHDPPASRRFYTTAVAPHAGLRLAHDAPDRVRSAAQTLLLARARRAPAHGTRPPRVPRGRGRRGAGLPRRRARRGLRGPRRPRRARRLSPGLLRRVRARPGRPQCRGRQPQPLSGPAGPPTTSPLRGSLSLRRRTGHVLPTAALLAGRAGAEVPDRGGPGGDAPVGS